MKRSITLFAAVLLLVSPGASVLGQEQPPADNEKLTAYKIAFFTQKLSLTPAEAEKFWPVYNDFSARKSKIQLDRASLMRYAVQNEANMSERELSEAADKLVQSFIEEANLAVSFNSSIKNILPPAKVIRLFQAENQYKVQLLKELNQRRQVQGGGTGPVRKEQQKNP